jgi:hypothetical protein
MGAQLGGARWVDPRTGCNLPWRRSEAQRPNLSSAGVTADDVPQSNATGAADEPALPKQSLQRPGIGRGG